MLARAPRLTPALIAGLLTLAAAGCPPPADSGKKGGEATTPGGDAATAGDPAAEPGPPPAGDEPFPADLPFEPSEWTTSNDYAPLGAPDAKRVSKEPFRIIWADFPATLRTDGPSSNTSQGGQVHGLMFESLVQIHPETEEFIPCLASHWKVERDPEAKTQVFWFRIDPRARFADGSEVTAKDVYASWWHRIQADRNDPTNLMIFKEQYETPEILDKYTIRVKTKEFNWRLFLYFGGMSIFKASECQISGEQYLDGFNWKLMTGSGPYVLPENGIKTGDSVTLVRRDDWWAENEPWAKNTYNFAKVKFVVIREKELEYETFKKGELDYFVVGKAKRWVDEIPKEEIVDKGWVQRRKVYNQSPAGYSGLAFNMRKKPFDDRNVRLAFAHLFNRERLMEKKFYNEYEYTNSYFPGRDWGNGKDNPPVDFDPDRAEELLAKAGYKERDEEGYLVGPDGKRLSITLEFGYQSWEEIWLIVKEDYEDAGIEFNLKLIDPATLWKKVQAERQFRISFMGWGALLFPNPESSWKSELADQNNNNNICGFKNARVDELCKQYDLTFDRAEQKKITREIDRIIYEEHPYALGWHANFNRILFWDKFGYPSSYLTRIGQVPASDMLMLWWFDPDKDAALAEAQKAGAALPKGEVVVKPWEAE